MPTIKFLTWMTLVVEFACGALIWFRDLRYYVLASAFILHLGLEWSMNVPLFQWIMMFTALTFVYPEDMQKALDWLKQKSFTRSVKQADAIPVSPEAPKV